MCYLLAFVFSNTDLGGYLLTGGFHALISCIAVIVASIPAMAFAHHQNHDARQLREAMAKQKKIVGVLEAKLKEVSPALEKAKAELSSTENKQQESKRREIEAKSALTISEEKLRKANLDIKKLQQSEGAMFDRLTQLDEVYKEQAKLIEAQQKRLKQVDEFLEL